MKPQLNVRGLRPAEINQLAETILAAMTGNPNFPNPTPGIAEISADLNVSKLKLTEAEEAFQQLRIKRAERREATAKLVATLRALLPYVQTASGGEETKILSSGYSVQQPAQPVGPMPQPQGVRVLPNGSETSCIVEWERIYGADSYVVECAAEPTGTWHVVAVSPRAEAEISGLVTGSRCYFRVRAIGAAGAGPWSDIAMKIIG